jgi:putative endonuclease
MKFFVYAIYNNFSKKIYIGQTNNLEKRILEHNEKFGDHYTTKFQGNWILIYKEEFRTRSEALIREKQLKSYRGREFIKNLIKIKNSAPL